MGQAELQRFRNILYVQNLRMMLRHRGLHSPTKRNKKVSDQGKKRANLGHIYIARSSGSGLISVAHTLRGQVL